MTEPSRGGDPASRLARPPGERYTRPSPAPPAERPGRGLVAPVLVAVAGAAALFALGLLDLGPGLIAAGAAIGWAVGIAVRWRGTVALPDARGRIVAGAVLGSGAVALGLLAVWAWSRLEGGVLGPLDYLEDRFGLVWLAILAAGAVAGAWRAR